MDDGWEYKENAAKMPRRLRNESATIRAGDGDEKRMIGGDVSNP